MTPRSFRKVAVPLVAVVALSLGISGCGGGGGGGGASTTGAIIALSFVGFVTQPSGNGPNGQVPLPEVFLDQTLEFQFDADIDDGILGGFFMQGGAPLEFVGVSASATTGGVPYYAYVDQALAANALQVRQNAFNAPLVPSYIIGRHRDKEDTIVVDPRVQANNPLGLTFNGGFAPQVEYTYRIPANNAFRMGGGTPAAVVGVDPLLLPIVLNVFGPQPILSPVFRSGTSTGPDPVPPEIVSITATSGLAGTPGQPIPATDSLQITFSKPIDPVSLDLVANFLVRNQDLVTAQEPEGRLIPGNLVINPAQAQIVTFVPVPSFGPGVSPTQGYNIEVRVGTFGVTTVPEILGVPQGNPPQQLPVGNSLSQIFVTEPCPTCEGSVAVIETFTNNTNEDQGFTPLFDRALWNDAGSPGSLRSTPISGNPLATFTGNPTALGTQSQVNMPIGVGTTLALTTVPFLGLFSPFDDADLPGMPGSGNNLPGVNAMGGSHTMWLTEATDIGNPRSSLELIEWGPTMNTVLVATYPSYQMWAGMSSVTAPITCPTGTTGLSTIYAQNHDQVPPQPVDPNNTHPTIPGAGAVLVSPPGAYQAGPGFTSYFPYPTLSPPFDYIGSGTGQANLVYEVNIEPGTQQANFNRYRATAFTPVRRIIGAPLSSGMITSAGSGCDTYDLRFTFVSIVATDQSNFYDTGVVTGTPRYAGITFAPSPASQATGSSALWEFEGATAIAAPNAPVGVTSGFLTYWSGTPAAGQFFPGILEDPMSPLTPQLTGNRYFRFRVTLRNDNILNGEQQYNSLIAAIVVGGS
ncbi:MAG: hypothetical protein CMJ83_05895 [Planctomycetes bacterium]|nr:hypothetical protein [Planctomycetota bacterium]